jgi:hypothetical protein
MIKPPNLRTVPVQTRLSRDEADRLGELAHQKGLPISTYLISMSRMEERKG